MRRGWGLIVVFLAGLAVYACSGESDGGAVAPRAASSPVPQATAEPTPGVTDTSPRLRSLPATAQAEAVPATNAPSTLATHSPRQPSPSPTFITRPPTTAIATSSPAPTPIPLPTAAPSATPVRVPTPSATPTPTPPSDPVSTLEFSGFTQMPVDFNAVLDGANTCRGQRLTPFFQYLYKIEGPKKWYIYACPGDVVEVYLPAKGILDTRALRLDASGEGREGFVNGEKVIIDVGVSFDVSPDIYVFYAHLALRDEIRAAVQDSPKGYAVFDAGTHIGYIYWPPPSSYYSLDFGVSDRNIDRGLRWTPKFGQVAKRESRS